MAESKEYTYADVAAHNSKKDIFVVIHDQVYNCSSFVDEHPGGEEVLLDCAGQDATEAFEDVGHSDEAREILAGLLVGTIKRKPGDPVPKVANTNSSSAGSSDSSTGFGLALYGIIILGGAAAYFAYQYIQAQQSKQ